MRFTVGSYTVEWYRKESGTFWYEVYDGADCIVRGASRFPPQELDTEANVEKLLGIVVSRDGDEA